MWPALSKRRAELPPNWPSICIQVKIRDGYRCRWTYPRGGRCHGPSDEVDHIGDRFDHSLPNLRALCEDHHKRRTARQGNDAKREIRARRKRPAEPHPGSLV